MIDLIDRELRRVVEVLVADPPDLPNFPHDHPTRPRARGPAAFVLMAGLVAVAIAIPATVFVVDREPYLGPVPGDWWQGQTAPFAPRHGAFAAVLDDERVLVWGGGGKQGNTYTHESDGGIYDPESNGWEYVDPAPLADAFAFDFVKLADDRLLVFGQISSGLLAGAVFDIPTSSWSSIPTHPDVTEDIKGILWNGQTLAVVQVGGHYSLPFVPPYTKRWEYGADRWSDAAAFPLEPRIGVSGAATESQMAIWGGLSDSGRIHADGAIYRLDEDHWQLIPTAPIGGRLDAHANWIEAGFAVGGGFAEVTPDTSHLNPDGPPYDPGVVAGLAVYEPEIGFWRVLPSPPPGSGITGPFRQMVRSVWSESGEEQLLIHETWNGAHPHSGVHPAYWYDESTDTWEWSWMSDVHTADGFVYATSATEDNPDDVPFEVRLWDGDQWSHPSVAPFINRKDPAMAMVGDQLVLVGGSQGLDLDQLNDTWVIDLDG